MIVCKCCKQERRRPPKLYPYRCSCGATTLEDGTLIPPQAKTKVGRDGRLKVIMPLGKR